MEEAKVVVDEVPPYLRVYQDGTIERLLGTEFAAAGLDPETGVTSKDVVFQPETGVSARLYLPGNLPPHAKLPLVIYFHGGAFCISSSADPKYHAMLNILVARARVLLLSVDYRLAPEHPLPTAYDDSWSALLWAAAHASAASSPAIPAEVWLHDHADFGRVFLAGDSAGANISHHLAIRAGLPDIRGVVMMQPYFWGEEAVGAEAESPFFKAVVDKWWRFVCPPGSDRGCDDPLINPFAAGAGDLGGVGCGRVLVCVAGNDILRERGRLYYEGLKGSKWRGVAELYVTVGEDHVFHIMDPTSKNAQELIERCAEFINRE